MIKNNGIKVKPADDKGRLMLVLDEESGFMASLSTSKFLAVHLEKDKARDLIQALTYALDGD